MRLFHNRPLAALAAAFAAVSVAVFHLSGKIKLICAAVTAAIAAAVLLISLLPGIKKTITDIRHKRTVIAGVVLAAIAAIVVSYVYTDVLYASLKSRDGQSARVSGYVTDALYETSYSGSYRVVLTDIDGENIRVGAILETDFAAELSVGDGFSADVVLAALGDDGRFDEEAYYLPRGVKLKAVVEDVNCVSFEPEHKGIDITAAKLRQRISARLKVSLDGHGGNGLSEALFVGDRDAVEESIARDFQYIGASHLLAVSGLHLTVLIGGIEIILRRFISKTPRSVILISATVAYMALTGFSPSVVRAGVMMVIYCASHFARRESDSVTSLFVTAAGIMLFSPASAADTGLLLSVTAMLGCLFANKLFLSERIRGAFYRFARRGALCKLVSRAVKYAYGSLAISVSAILFTLPVVWLTFGRLSLLSPLAALFITPVITLILYLCPLVVIAFGVSFISAPISAACGALCRFAAWEASVLARIDGAGVLLSGKLPIATAGCVIIILCLIPALVLGRRAARRSISAACAVFVFIALSSGVYNAVNDADTVTYVNRGKNDAFVITDGNRMLICDVSDGSWSTVSLAVSESDAERVDVYMLTHLHRRHADTFGRLCRREYVREVWVPAPETEDEETVYLTIADTAAMHGVNVVTYERGELLSFGSVTVETAPRAMLKRSTHPVIAAAFDTDESRTVYIGGSVHESDLYGYAVDMCRDADAVVFGVHGPVYKSGAEYYLSPDVHVTYASDDVADYLKTFNPTDSFVIYGE